MDLDMDVNQFLEILLETAVSPKPTVIVVEGQGIQLQTSMKKPWIRISHSRKPR